MFCTKCGISLSEGQKFCDGCGILVGTGNSNNKAENQSEQNSKGFSELSRSMSMLNSQLPSIATQLETISDRLKIVEKKLDLSSTSTTTDEEIVAEITEGQKSLDEPVNAKKKKAWVQILFSILVVIIAVLVIVLVVYVFRSELLDLVEDWGLQTDWLKSELKI